MVRPGASPRHSGDAPPADRRRLTPLQPQSASTSRRAAIGKLADSREEIGRGRRRRRANGAPPADYENLRPLRQQVVPTRCGGGAKLARSQDPFAGSPFLLREQHSAEFAQSGTISALPNGLPPALCRHPDVDPILTRSLRDFAVGDDPAGKDLFSRPGKRSTGGDFCLLVVREVEEPWVSGHGFLIGESPDVAIPLRGA